MMKAKFPSIVSAIVAGMFVASSAHGQIIWGTPNTITDSSDISLAGTYVDAAGNFAGGGGTVAVTATTNVHFNGLTYDSSANTYSDGHDITLSNIVSDAGGDSYTGSNPVPVDYSSVMAGVAYTGNGQGPETGTVTLSNLVAGDQYQVEIWQARSGDPTRDTTYTSFDGNSVTTTGANYILGTFFAGSGDMQRFTFTGLTGELNTLQLRDLGVPVPEPSTVALMAAGLVGLAFIARRRRDHLTSRS